MPTTTPNVIYVNFKTKEASFVGYSNNPIRVGPIMSIIDNVQHITIHLSIKEIKTLREPQYQQLQITNQM